VAKDQQEVHEVSAFADKQSGENKERDEVMSDELAGCMSDIEQNNQSKEESKAAFEMPQPKNMQLNPGVLKEKELE
jgi:hypothetical protein